MQVKRMLGEGELQAANGDVFRSERCQACICRSIVQLRRSDALFKDKRKPTAHSWQASGLTHKRSLLGSECISQCCCNPEAHIRYWCPWRPLSGTTLA